MVNSPTIITISRQLGSGNALIGQQLANQLEITYLNRQIVTKAAEKQQVLEKNIEFQDERKTSFWESLLLSIASNPLGMYALSEISIPSQHKLLKVESEIIQKIAKEYSAIIISRREALTYRGIVRNILVFSFLLVLLSGNNILKNYINLSPTKAKKNVLSKASVSGGISNDSYWSRLV